jgi:hypothetical protein
MDAAQAEQAQGVAEVQRKIREAGVRGAAIADPGDVASAPKKVSDIRNVTGVSRLDMSQAARMQRAREMGFDTDRVLYHGTGADFDSLQPGQAPGWGDGVYLTDNPMATEEFAMRPGGNVIPAHAAIKNPFLGEMSKHPGVFTDANVMSTPAYQRKVRELGLDDDELFDWIDEWGEDGQFANELIRDLGFDGIIAPGSNNIDGLEVVVFEPSQVRSVNAAFDPAKSDAPGLLD